MVTKPTHVVRALIECPDCDFPGLQRSLKMGAIDVLSYGHTGFLVDVSVSADDHFEAVENAATELRARGGADLRLARLVSVRSK